MRSFAARQAEAYERGGLGWSFSVWKFPDARLHPAVVAATSLSGALAAGWVAPFGAPGPAACLRGVVQDAALGDATEAPTPGPPPPYVWVPPPCPGVSLEDKLTFATYGAGAVLGAVGAFALLKAKGGDAARAAPYDRVDSTATSGHTKPAALV